MRKLQNPTQASTRSTRSISVSWLLLSVKATAKLVTNYTNKIQVSDVLQVIRSAVSAQYQSVWKMMVMLHSSMQPTA